MLVNNILDRAHYKYVSLDPTNRIDMVLMEVRNFSRGFSKRFAHNRRVKRETYNRKLTALHKKLAMINLSSEKAIQIIQRTNEKIDEIKRQMEKESLVDTQGAMLRSKAKFMAEGEHSTKYFFGLEKSNARSKTMNITYKEDHTITRNQQEILPNAG